MEYEIIRSKRRTLSLEVTRGARVLVRAPVNCPQETIDSFVRSHEAWLKKAVERVRAGELAHPEPDEQERQRLIERAKQVIPRRVAYFSLIMGLTPTGVRITGARTRFGSCSAKNSLCFSCFLMRCPEEAVDLVVVHELCHIRVKNHGPAFYALLEQTLPDWRERKRLLR